MVYRRGAEAPAAEGAASPAPPARHGRAAAGLRRAGGRALTWLARLRAAVAAAVAAVSAAWLVALVWPLAAISEAMATEAAGRAVAPAPLARPARPGFGAIAFQPLALRARAIAWAPPPGAPVRVTGALVLDADDPRFGGFSGIAADPDGGGATLVSDRGLLLRLRFERRDGALHGVAEARAALLPGLDGKALPWASVDAEGLARLPDGALAVSFEGPSRIWRLDGAQATAIPGPAAFAQFQRNSGLEALAAGPDGALHAIPERSGAPDAPFPVHRRDAMGGWSVGSLPRMGPFLVTGAEIDPEGRALHVLERDFNLFQGGFSWRLRVAPLDDWPDLAPRTLLTAWGGVDNMEGLALWRDAGGATRLLLVADDNFQPLQRTLLLELVLD